MKLNIQMIGTGSAFSKRFFNNNALIRCGGYTLLVDCGTTAPLALHRLKIGFDQIDGVLITHLHGDHVGGLEELAFQLLYIYNQRKIDLFIPDKLVKPLWENTLKGNMEMTTEGARTLESYFNVLPVPEKQRVDIHPGFCVETIQTRHIPNKPSFSLFFNDYLFYSSDIVFDRTLLYHVHQDRGCKYILQDCQLTPPGAVHATLDELLTLPEELQSKMYLMHYGDQMEQFIGKTGKMEFLVQHEIYEFD